MFIKSRHDLFNRLSDMLSLDVVAALQCDETQALYILFAIGRSLYGLSAGKCLKNPWGSPETAILKGTSRESRHPPFHWRTSSALRHTGAYAATCSHVISRVPTRIRGLAAWSTWAGEWRSHCRHAGHPRALAVEDSQCPYLWVY